MIWLLERFNRATLRRAHSVTVIAGYATLVLAVMLAVASIGYGRSIPVFELLFRLGLYWFCFSAAACLFDWAVRRITGRVARERWRTRALLVGILALLLVCALATLPIYAPLAAMAADYAGSLLAGRLEPAGETTLPPVAAIIMLPALLMTISVATISGEFLLGLMAARPERYPLATEQAEDEPSEEEDETEMEDDDGEFEDDDLEDRQPFDDEGDEDEPDAEDVDPEDEADDREGDDTNGSGPEQTSQTMSQADIDDDDDADMRRS